MSSELIKQCEQRYNTLKTEKEFWNTHYQSLAESFLTRKQNFTTDFVAGEFLQSEIFDNTGQFTAQLMASAFLSMLWPDSARSFVIEPTPEFANTPGVEKYFKNVNEVMYSALDNPKAGLGLALQEHFLDQGIFGTSGVSAFANNKDGVPITFSSWGVKNMCITENSEGLVDGVYYERTYTTRQIMDSYEEDEVSPEVKALFNSGGVDKKIKVLIVLDKRSDRERKGKEGAMGMACRSLHIDLTNKHLMKEEGYGEFPVFVVRFFKTTEESYGRSPGMMALPDQLSLNVLKESLMVATEKQLDPPLGIMDDGRLGGGTIDTSAGALNVFNMSGRAGAEKAVFPLFTVGELNSPKELIEEFKAAITQAFFIDRLLNINNEVQMTAYETSVRRKMQGESLTSVFSRQIVELFTPLVERCFNILFRKEMFGPLPEGLANTDKEVYNIRYISPAKRFMEGDKLQGILNVADFLVTAGAAMPSVVDNVDLDELTRSLVKHNGVSGVLRVIEDVEKLRAEVAESMAQEKELEAAQQLSGINRDVAQADALKRQ